MYKLILLISLILLVGCTSTSEKLNGTWLLEDFGYGKYSHSIISFLPSGDKCVISYEFLKDGSIEFDYYLNSYVVENNTLITRVVSSNSKYLYEGYEIRDDIKEITASKLILLMVKPTSTNPRFENHTRLPYENPERVCEVVRAQLDL